MTKREARRKAHGMVVDMLFAFIENGEWVYGIDDPVDVARVSDAIIDIKDYHRLHRDKRAKP